MIVIQERPTRKIPGNTSLFVSFKYNQNIVNVLKNVTDAHDYNKDNHEWEIPITDLSKILDALCLQDQIQLEVLPETKKQLDESTDDIVLGDHKTKPYPYQEDGVKYGLTHNNFLLLDEPGLGKTLQAILLAEELKEREGIEHCLVICGINTLKANWVKEIEKHSKYKCMVLGQRKRKNGKTYYGGIKDRLEDLKNPIDEFFVILNIETLRDPNIVKELNNTKNNRFGLILVDECHKFKSPTAEQTKGFLKLSQGSHRVAMTGTLLLNNPCDSYVALKFIGAEHSTFTNFKFYYCKFTGPYNNILIGYRNIDSLKAQLDANGIRRTKDILDLPPKTIIDEFLDMNDDQCILYENITEGIVDQIDKVELNTTNLLTMMARLRQAADCPSMLTTERVSSAKASRVKELVEEITQNGDKVVIFDVYKQPLNDLCSELKEYNPLLCTGDVKDSEISKSIDMFQNDSEHKVMLCTTQKMGTGITLTRARYAIFMNTPWTYAEFQQCMDRIHRIGSNNSVFIYCLWCKDTVDERVKEIVESKEMISEYVIDGKCSPNMHKKLKEIIVDLKRI